MAAGARPAGCAAKSERRSRAPPSPTQMRVIDSQ
jgi:hypothetical protein